jgi:hypothetical protein
MLAVFLFICATARAHAADGFSVVFDPGLKFPLVENCSSQPFQEFLTCLICYLTPPDHFLLAMGKNNTLKMLLAAGPPPLP